MEEMSIGAFARASRLSPKALRIYDELGLLAPVRVDESSGYRYYDAAQLERARLVSALRRLGVPLAEIGVILDTEPAAAAERITAYWAAAEAEHVARRRLAGHLVDLISGKRSAMYDVNTRDIPERSLLCLKRNVEGEPGAWAFGKEFVALLRRHRLPTVEDGGTTDGRAGATFCIYWGEVNQDSDGPLEWCRPVPSDRAAELAAQVPELTLRLEPAHREAFVQLGPGGQMEAAQWPLVIEALQGWAERNAAHPLEIGARITYLAGRPITADSVPDCDFAVPVS